MKRLSKKGIIVSIILACSLVIGTVEVSAESNATSTKKVIQTVSKKKVVSKKGVITLPKKFKTKTVMSELRPEAAKLIKTYGASLGDGKTKAFKTYVIKHVATKKDGRYMLGHDYTVENYNDKVKRTREANTKKNNANYSKAVKKVTTSKVEYHDYTVRKGFADFSFSFLPKNYSPMNTVVVNLCFTQLENGKYVLEKIYYF